jgi:hypothetical protein
VCLRQRVVPGAGKRVIPVALYDVRPRTPGHFDRAIGRPGVVHHDLVGQIGDRFEARRQHGLLVLDDEADRDEAEGWHVINAPFLCEPAAVFGLMMAPVHSVGVEGDVGGVVHKRPVGDQQPESGDPQLHAEVVILVPSDRILLVESAHQPEDLGPHGQAEPHQARGFGRPASMCPPLCCCEFAHGGQIVLGVFRPQELVARHVVRTRTNRAHLGIDEGGQELMKPAAVHNGVVVQEDDHVAVSCGRPLVAAPGEALVHVVAYDVDPRVPEQALRGAVGRTVVDDDDLVLWSQGRLDRVQAGSGVVPGVPGQDDQGGPWSRLFGAHNVGNGPSGQRIDPCQDHFPPSGRAFHSRRRSVSVMSSLEEIDAVLSRAEPVDASVLPATLRQWRTELVRASVFVSYAIGVLSLDMEILTRGAVATCADVLQATVDDLPDLLASGWVGGGWSLSPDAAASVAAAAEVALDESDGLLALHGAVATSDLDDPDVVADLLVLVQDQLQELARRREQLESRIREIQATVLQHYASGAASVDDWLT